MRSNLEAALAPIVETLEADGYGATIAELSGVLQFRITAGLDACEDCLSPRAILEPVIINALRRNGLNHHLELTYPDEAR